MLVPALGVASEALALVGRRARAALAEGRRDGSVCNKAHTTAAALRRTLKAIIVNE